ncbi:striatin-interacting protein 1 homolog [Sinocyclocheilus rhinocerous]|uniref:striatin-interacting protein 1 homolog n=1 Tax=Sinocyclocheilus rhinocerous TaxID=307959 RepID=UPI0007BA0053|nr:PREDICTED: striatin-interacting protein 1 homolog [Sinocyclocheilus rhinocerous]
MQQQTDDMEGSMESPNLEFEYGDTDSFTAELSELYSYTEEPEFSLNRDYFEEDFKNHVKGRRWMELSMEEQRAYVMRLLDALEVTDRDKRLKVARAILYLAQGVFDECDTETDVLYWSRHNVFLLYDMGIFTALLELLSMEIDNNQACSSAVRKPAISLADSTELSFALLLFTMVTKFCSMNAPHFPMKKVLLLLWKTILFTLGGFEELQEMKVRMRELLNLSPLPEDSIKVVRNMRAASPPASAMELIEQQQQQKRGRRSRRSAFVDSLEGDSPYAKKQPLVKQDSLDTYNERDPFKNDDARDEEDDPEDVDSGIEGEVDPLDRDVIIQPPPPPPPLRPPTERVSFPKGLPWAPKVREKDIEHFLETSRNKFIGFTLGNDTDTLVGLPRPIHESVKTLKLSNCIPLILKFFNQNIMSYISAKNSICALDFPHCVVHEMPELTAESLEAGDSNQFCWRNLFSCINLLRILNKITKWKHSRTMMLVVFKSAPILKRALKVKQAMMQLYVLKLLKIQTKYLGRQWRKSNMKTMSAIYQKVRHRLNDDWAYGNDIDARPWDFQAEECALRESIEKFNMRRYDKNQNSEFTPVDNCLQSVLGQRVDLPEDFHYSYEMWLEREVFSQPIQWEGLLQAQ